MAQINWSDVKQKLTLYNQDHLLQWVDELTIPEQQNLYADISAIDFDKLQRSVLKVKYLLHVMMKVTVS